jgi:hypothetical protein
LSRYPLEPQPLRPLPPEGQRRATEATGGGDEVVCDLRAATLGDVARA